MKKVDKNQQEISQKPINGTKNESSILIPLLIFFLPVCLYLQTLSFGLTNFDDDSIITNNSSFFENFSNAPKVFLTDAFISKATPFYRPLQTLSYMIDIQLSGGQKFWMLHLSNVLLLSLIAYSLFCLLRLFQIPPKPAFLSTLLYCAHPLFVSTIAWIPARGDLFLTLFALLSFIFLIKFLKEEKTLYLILHWLAFTLALFSKETAAFLPLLYLGYYFILGKSSNRKYLLTIGLYILSGAGWFWLRSIAIQNTPVANNDVFGLSPVIANAQTITEALSKFLFPFDFAPIPAFSILKTLAGLAIICLLIMLLFKSSENTKREKLFFLGWFIVLLIPTMLFKHKLIDYLDHRFFLPLIGILLFILLSLPKSWFENGNFAKPWLPTGLILLLACITLIKSRSYSSPMAFYNTAVLRNNNSAIAYSNRGFLKNNNGDLTGALADFNKAIELSPTYDHAYNSRGYIKNTQGDKAGAIKDFDLAISINSQNPAPYFNRGKANMDLGNFKNAIEDFQKYNTLQPANPESYNYIGMAMGSLNNFNEAVTNFNKAIEIYPDYLEAYGNRSIAKYYTKDLQGALNDCNKVLEINSKDERALNLRNKIKEELPQ